MAVSELYTLLPRIQIKHSTRDLQEPLGVICMQYQDDSKIVEQTLAAAAHTIRFV